MSARANFAAKSRARAYRLLYSHPQRKARKVNRQCCRKPRIWQKKLMAGSFLQQPKIWLCALAAQSQVIKFKSKGWVHFQCRRRILSLVECLQELVTGQVQLFLCQKPLKRDNYIYFIDDGSLFKIQKNAET